jgi:hypothetical protein
MSAKRKKKKRNNFFGAFIVVIILPLLLVNIWAGWKILKVAEALEIPLLGSVHNGPMQLAGLLLINCVVITLLAAAKEK